MAFRIKYARLFECHIRHGFYLHQGDRTNYYGLDPVADATTIRSLNDNFRIDRSLVIQPLPQTVATLRGHRMQVAYTGAGFFVGIAVNEVEDAGITYFTPRLLPNPGQTWYFGLRVVDPNWGTITEERMRPNVPAQYYFTNLAASPADAAISLSRRAAEKEPRTYHAGERVLDPGGPQLYRSLRTDDANAAFADTDFWEDITDHHEVNDADRLLLPQNFTYRFTPLANVTITEAQVELKATDGTVVDTRNYAEPNGLISIPLDYRQEDRHGWFDLVVTGTGGYATNKRILIDPDLYDPANWGVVAIGHVAALPYASRLLEADNRLRNNAGITEPPVFSIRIPNRYSYWRYRGHPSQTLDPVVDDSGVSPQGDRLVTNEHKPLTRYGSKVEYKHTPTDEIHLLPDPGTTMVIPDEEGKLYSDVYLGILNL